ncbi:hypothetical protein T484DRAFT_1894743 [Baffinella frigidus]|nr:hypothetical protein T484DRAFT_1894743 [Cryptophyta sp. CCMP2293]
MAGGTAPQRGVSCLRFSSDGTFLASSGRVDKLVKIWDTATWSLRRTIRDISHPSIRLAWSPDENKLAVLKNAFRCTIWDLTKQYRP